MDLAKQLIEAKTLTFFTETYYVWVTMCPGISPMQGQLCRSYIFVFPAVGIVIESQDN